MRPPGNVVSQALGWRSRVCSRCLCQLSHAQWRTLATTPRSSHPPAHYIAEDGSQAFPLAGYYSEILGNPQRKVFVQQPHDITSKTSRAEARRQEIAAKARIVFGSKLAGPIQRKKQIAEASKVVAGVRVPPRPEEPDNCCMSGCVNCVWDQYRDELEEWATKSAEARAAIEKKRAEGLGTSAKASTPASTSMDDDGGGSETNWDVDLGTAGANVEDYFKDIPVGIREFMRTEKRLKEMHRQ